MNENLLNETSSVSVGAVVVNFNGGDCTLRCLEAIGRQSCPPATIVVVDNGSADGSPGQIRQRFPDVQLIEFAENRGLPAARNAGIARLQTDVALLVDNDVYLEPDCLEKMIVAYREDGPAVICPRIRLIPQREVVQADGAEVHFLGTMVLRHGYRPIEQADAKRSIVGGCIGACYLFERRVAIDAGGFDELLFFYLEDLEFAIRLRAFGQKFICEPTAQAFHERGEGTAGLSFRGRGAYPLRRVYLQTRHRLITMLVHYHFRTLVVLLPALVLYEVAGGAFAVVRGWVGPWCRAWWWVLTHPGAVLERRRLVQGRRRVNDRCLLVGGAIPLSPGLIQSSLAAGAVRCLSAVLNLYWRITRCLIR